jgi:hypothetical protein
MQRYIIFFTIVNALHVSSSSSAHHQELKTVHNQQANKMQRYIIFFTIFNALHVSSSSSAHHQELKPVHNQQDATLYNIPDAVCTVLSS